MSYTNPKIYAPDPTAFARGFSESFQTGVQMFAQQKAEKDKLRKESEQAEAFLLNQTDLGGYQDLDKRIYDRFQQNIRGVVDSGTFANMTPAEKQRALFEIRDLKQGFDKFKEILAMPTNELDIRNSDLIELKTAIAKNPDALNISGEGANMSLDFTDSKGNKKSISINGLNSTRVINKQEFESALNNFDDEMFKQANSFLLAGAKTGKYQQAENLALNDYTTALQDQLEEEDYSYIYANKIGGTYEGTPEQKQQVLDYKIGEFKQRVDSRKEYADIFAPKDPGQQDDRSKTQILRDQTAEQRVNSLDSMGFIFDTSKRGEDYDIHADTKFINNMSNLGFNVSPVISPGGEKGFTVKDQITNNAITIYPSKQTQEQTKNQLKSLITSQSTRPILPK